MVVIIIRAGSFLSAFGFDRRKIVISKVVGSVVRRVGEMNQYVRKSGLRTPEEE